MDTATLAEAVPLQIAAPVWSPLRRIGFRFCVVYFGLFCVLTQVVNSVLIVPKLDIPDWATLPPFRQIIFWVAAHVFGLKTPLVYSGSGSGDKQFDWVLLFCIAVAAIAATALWSALDRRRTSYPALYRWFWLFLRFCLAGQMLVYGFIKAFPLQMPYPFLSRLMERFGDMSPMGVLWWSVGAAPGWETFAGCAELLGGLLLMFPRTITLGALIALADMTQVFMLNMTYDVPVKILIVISLLLLGPDLRRLADFFFLNRAAASSTRPALFAGLRARRISGIVIAIWWAWMVGNNLYNTWDSWHQYGPGRQKSALYGIWTIQDESLDGKPVALLATDATTWRQIIFDFPQYTEIERMGDSRGYGTALDEKTTSVTLTDLADRKWQAKFRYTRAAFDKLSLEGSMGGHPAVLHLVRMDEKKLVLESRGFHWVQDYPFNR